MELVFALDYIPRRMKELGFEDYAVRYRHIRVLDKSSMTIEGQNQIWLAINPSTLLTIRSKAGIFKWNDKSINEQQYEHRGKITVVSDSSAVIYQLFIQVIPLHSNNKKKQTKNGNQVSL